ncbi:MAG: TetR/AcrR family transcriptional regulator [Spirosomataceae bacterium]
MPKIDSHTKEKILVAAEKVFHAHGFKGTRTSLIAEEAGISRTMLHYYYSTKEALFQAVLTHTLNAVFTHIKRVLEPDMSLEALVNHLVDVVADLLEEKPGLPSFIVNILNETPEIAQFLSASKEDNLPAQLDALLVTARATGQIRSMLSGEDLILNLYALCSIPYLGASYIKAKENRDDECLKEFIRARRASTKEFIWKGLQGY